MIEFKLPSLGSDMDEGKLLQWKVAPGDAVKRGQVVAVVDTSKAAVDVESWQEGTVFELLAEPGEVLPVGAVLATLLEAGETPATAVRHARPAPLAAPASVEPALAAPAAREPAAPPPPGERAAAISPAAARRPAQAAPATRAAPVTPGRRRISPAARRRAEELRIDPDTLAGTGPAGAITVQDVEQAAGVPAAAAPAAVAPAAPAAAMPAAPAAATPAPQGAPAGATLAAPGARQAEMRRAIAAAMSRSKREIPHYYLAESIPLRKALDWLGAANAQRGIAERLLPAVLQLKAVAIALKRYPDLNGVMADGAFRPSAAAHIGVAISLRQGGLIAPAIHDVGDKTLDELMRDLTGLVARARAGSLRSSEMSDPTITVTNLGDQGVESVFGVIYPPQVALVGFGRIGERPWVEEGAP